MKKYPVANEHGVYPEAQAECIEYKSPKECASIHLLEVADNTWVQSSNVRYADGGMGEPLSKDRTYNTRNEALAAALWRVESYCKNCAPRVAKWAAQQSVHLTAFGDQQSASYPLQLSFFADDQPATIGGR